jgi:eukaryotic-like serine/threonine-protein kinase
MATQKAPSLVDPYVLYDEIGRGGLATVHLARLLGPGGFQRTVAIKRLHPGIAKDQESVHMLIDDACLSARITHPNVVPTLDVVVRDDEIFVVMEYVEGESLSALVRRALADKRAVPASVAAAIAKNVLEGLHAAHEATREDGTPLGIVHRDVSPQNVLIDTNGAARLIDFGVAKALGRLQTTRAGDLKGKVSYMSPEQVRGRAVDRRSDVFSASIVLWELLAGARLFAADSDTEAMVAVLEREIGRPTELRADVTAELEEVLLRGLARDPDHRFADARAMAFAIGPVASPTEVRDWMMSLAGDAIEARAQRVREIEAPPRTPTARRGRALVAALAIAAAGALVFLVARPKAPPRLPEVAAPSAPIVEAPPAPAAIEPDPPAPSAVEAPPRTPRRAQAPTGKPAASHAVTRSCVPPFTIDASGVRVWKPWCQ